MRQHTVSVPILQDIIKEEKEQFQANLELVNDNGLSVVIRPAVANVTIVDSNIGEFYMHIHAQHTYHRDTLILTYMQIANNLPPHTHNTCTKHACIHMHTFT